MGIKRNNGFTSSYNLHVFAITCVLNRDFLQFLLSSIVGLFMVLFLLWYRSPVYGVFSKHTRVHQFVEQK